MPDLNTEKEPLFVEKLIYNFIPRDGLDVSNANLETKEDWLSFFEMTDSSYAAKILLEHLPDNEKKEVLVDNIITRGEMLGTLAALGNKSHVKNIIDDPSESEIAVMIERMEKWGLDAADPHQLRMIEGLARLEKAGQIDSKPKGNNSNISKDFAQNAKGVPDEAEATIETEAKLDLDSIVAQPSIS